MTAERPTSQAGARPAGLGGDRPAGLGPLGRRLLAAFVLVALSSVLVLTVAALVGADRGLTATHQADRQQLAARVAAAAASSTGGRTPGMGGGPGPGMDGGSAGQAGASWPVVVEGRTVGSVRLGFTTPPGRPGGAWPGPGSCSPRSRPSWSPSPSAGS